MMRRFLALLLCGLLMLSLCSAACAEEGYRPEDVDISDVREEDGRLIGTIHLPEGDVSVDCAVPTAWTEDQQARLQISRRAVTVKEFAAALAAIGVTADEKHMEYYQSPESTMVTYQLEADHRLHVACNPFAVASPELSAKVKDALVALSEQLNCPMDTESFIAKPILLDGEAVGVEGEMLYQVQGRPVSRELVDVDVASVSYICLGMLMDGQVIHAAVNGLPVVESKEDAPLPDTSWQERLKGFILNDPVTYEGMFVGTIEVLDDAGKSQVVPYTPKYCITDISLFWVSRKDSILEPGCRVMLQERLTYRDEPFLHKSWYTLADLKTIW